MKTPVEQLEAANLTMDAQAKEIAELKAQIAAMEDEKKKAEENEKEDEKDEEDKAKKKAKAEEDKEDEEDEKDKAMKAMSAKVNALDAFIRSPEFRASCVAGSGEGAPEGGSTPTKTMTQADALKAYNAIDPNDAKARAAFRVEHRAELGL